jgi:acetyl esterase/lipase
VSVNYRLCPQVSFQEQLDDIKDAWTWCHENLPQVLGGMAVDVRKCVVAGDSAGGCFASLSGFHFEPKPKVIVNLYGPVQLRHPHFHVPAANYKEQLAKAKYLKRGTEDELQAALVDNDPSKAKTRYIWWHDMGIPIERVRGFLGVPDLEVDENQKLRMDLYTYMSITRTRFSSVFRKHNFQTENEFQAELDKFSSLSKIKELPPSLSYPPTFFLHGNSDTAAPIGPSMEFYDQLEKRDIDCEARWAEGAEHSFDAFIDVSPSLISQN